MNSIYYLIFLQPGSMIRDHDRFESYLHVRFRYSKILCCFIGHMSYQIGVRFESLSDPKFTPNDPSKLKVGIDFENEYKRQHFSFERPRLGKCLLCCTRDIGHVIKLPNNINWINIQFLLSISHWTFKNLSLISIFSVIWYFTAMAWTWIISWWIHRSKQTVLLYIYCVSTVLKY